MSDNAARFLAEDYECIHNMPDLFKPKVKEQHFVEVDHVAKWKHKDVQEIAEAGRRLGLSEGAVQDALGQLAALLPGLQPNLFKMRAADWARVLANMSATAALLITFKSEYPGADASAAVAARPQMLLLDPARLRADAQQVRHMLSSLGPADSDHIIQAVPSATDPRLLSSALANLAAMHPGADVLHMVAQDPTRLLQSDESDLDATPTYGRSFW